MLEEQTISANSALAFYKQVERIPTEENAYRRYVDFVIEYSPANATILELGCGSGLSSSMIARHGFAVTGLDVTASLLKKNYDHGTGTLTFVQADVTKLPFANASFDIISSFDLLEHLTDVPACLSEMLRVLRPGGRLIVVGPNLLTPLGSLATLAAWVRGRHGFQKPFGAPQDHIIGSPWGTSGTEIIKILLRNAWYTFRTATASQPVFFKRQPNFDHPPHGDIDSITLTNPIAFRKYLKSQGFTVIKYQGEGRTGRFGSFAGGVWLVGQKPANL